MVSTFTVSRGLDVRKLYSRLFKFSLRKMNSQKMKTKICTSMTFRSVDGLLDKFESDSFLCLNNYPRILKTGI